MQFTWELYIWLNFSSNMCCRIFFGIWVKCEYVGFVRKNDRLLMKTIHELCDYVCVGDGDLSDPAKKNPSNHNKL